MKTRRNYMDEKNKLGQLKNDLSQSKNDEDFIHAKIIKDQIEELGKEIDYYEFIDELGL